MITPRAIFQEFRRACGGNTALIFGLSFFLLVAMTGGAVDFSRYIIARENMQDATDAAALRGALKMSEGMTSASSAADEAFSENFTNDEISGLTRALTKTTSDNTTVVTYSASATIEPYFLALVGLGTQTLSATSVATSEVDPFELALVLDTTGSMARDSKMTYLKSSVTAVLTSLLDSSGANSVGIKVGVVPFNTQVRMTASSSYAFVDYSLCYQHTTVNYYACLTVWKAYDAVCASATSSTSCLSTAASRAYYKSWTSGDDTYASAAIMAYEKSGSKYYLYTYTITTYVDASTGVMTTTASGLTTTSATSIKTYTNYSPSGYTQFSSTYFTNIKSSWTGCFVDRNQDYDVSAAPNDVDVPDSFYIAAPCTYSTLPTTLDLTTSISTTKSYVNALTTGGNTNITNGIQFGMELLSPDTPYTTGVEFGDDDMDKYMIIVTDGENTANRWSTTESVINARTALACKAAKAKDITLFVVRVEDGDSDLLETCATKTAYYYDLSSASELTATMQDIFSKIGKLRITQ